MLMRKRLLIGGFALTSVIAGSCAEDVGDENAAPEEEAPPAATTPPAAPVERVAQPAVAISFLGDAVNEVLTRCARGYVLECDEAHADDVLNDDAFSSFQERCDTGADLYCSLLENLVVSELRTARAIDVPWFSETENRDLIACSLGSDMACEAMHYPGLLGDSSHELFREKCGSGEDIYCRVIENLEASRNE